MTSVRLHQLKSLSDVARACGVDEKSIEDYSSSGQQASLYRALRIPKRGGGRKGEFRVVFATKHEWLAQLHRGIAMIVARSVQFGDQVQGFLKGRSIKSNARVHCGAKILLHADIRSFFDTIKTEDVSSAFVAAGVPVEVCDVLARACTIDGALRQGTRCSPILANLVCQDLDRALLQLASAHNAKYTRYADDLTFSGDDVPDESAVRRVIESFAFEMHEEKCYRQRRGRSQFVTGLSVVDPERPRLPRRLKRRLRLVMHYIELYGVKGHFNMVGSSDPGHDLAWLEGMLRFARSIEPELVGSWQEILDAHS